MKVEAITLREIQMPLVHFFETSFGRLYSRRILLLTVQCDGITGWGESVAAEDPFYSSEWIEPAWSTIKDYLAPAVLGRTVTAAHESAGLMARVRGHRMAKAAIENALWDAEAQQKQMPHPVFRTFPMAVHHRAGGGNAQSVCCTDDVDPLADFQFVWT